MANTNPCTFGITSIPKTNKKTVSHPKNNILNTAWFAAIIKDIEIYSNFQIKDNWRKAVSSMMLIKVTNIQIEKALINDPSRVSKVPCKLRITAIYNFAVIAIFLKQVFTAQ